MKIFFCIILLFFALYEVQAKENSDSMFLINRETNTNIFIDVLDSGILRFYDINDSFLFITEINGNFKLLKLNHNKWERGSFKPKKHLGIKGAKFSEFRGNTPHIGNFKGTEFSEFHIDESINYYSGSFAADIIEMKYLLEFNAVVLLQKVNTNPNHDWVRIIPNYERKNGKSIYQNVKTIVETPEVVFSSDRISKLIIHEKSAKIAFLTGDTLLVQMDLRGNRNRRDFYDIGKDFEIGFVNQDSILIFQKDGVTSILSLINYNEQNILSEIDLKDKHEIKIIGKNLFCIKNNQLFILEFTTNKLEFKKQYNFTSEIISYKFSRDGMKIIVQTR